MLSAEHPVYLRLGQFEPAALPGVLCPVCAYFEDGRCHWCPVPNEPGYPADFPECEGCEGRTRGPTPWYKNPEIVIPLVTTVMVSVVATVASAIVLRRIGYR